MWTDSTIVLQWLNANDTLPVFLGNRVGKTLESTTIDEKHHALSGDNPADSSRQGMRMYPEAASVVAEKFRMDNDFDSFESFEQAVKISRDFVNLLVLVA